MACCGAGSCQFFGNCIDSREFFATSTACDHGCQQDVNTIKCTASSKPFCFVYTVPGLSAGFYSCDSSTGIDTLFTTFFGQTGALPWTNVYKETSTGISTTTPSVSPGPTTSTTSVTTIPPPTPGPSGDSVPIGAIVGGALGGLAFIALVIGAVVFLCLYHRKKERGQATATQDLNRPYSNQVPIAVSDVKHYSGAPNGPYPYGIMVGKDGPI